jgi:hypothetical protein
MSREKMLEEAIKVYQSNRVALGQARIPDLDAALSTPSPASAIGEGWLTEEQVRDLIAELREDAIDQMPDVNCGGLPVVHSCPDLDALERMALSALRTPAPADGLRDAHAVHVNMLRGEIASLTPAQVAHLYSDTECAEIVAEIRRQHPTLRAPAPANDAPDSVCEVCGVTKRHHVEQSITRGTFHDFKAAPATDGALRTKAEKVVTAAKRVVGQWAYTDADRRGLVDALGELEAALSQEKP